jgi:glycosyltransferase involved in cell wall biosynthesis
MSLYLPAILVRLLAWWERRLLKSVDVTITASTILRDEFLKLNQGPVITLGNFQFIEDYTAVTNRQIQSLRADLGVTPEQLLAIYIGGFHRNRVLKPFIESIQRVPNAQIHIWGEGHQREFVEEAADRYPGVTYHGWLPAKELPRHFKAADVVYYGLFEGYPGAVYNAPNTLAHAMAAGRPIIANRVGDLGRIINQTQCGILLDQLTTETIAQAMQQLKDRDLRHQMGTNGFKAAQSAYNASVVGEQLIRIYQDLERSFDFV